MRLRLFEDCRSYGVPLIQCPSFLFLILGFVTIVAMVATHLLASRYTEEPQVATLIVIGVTIVLLVIGQSIVGSFRRLAEANAAKSEFVSIASHQLRTPLASLKWAESLLKESTPSPEYITIIRDNTERMIQLVNELLDVSRIESGALRLKREPVSLEVITREALARFTPLATSAHIELDGEIPAGLPRVRGDAERVKFVVENLLDNAVRYTPGGGSIVVALGADKETVRWSVKDPGVGIGSRDRKMIFQKFFRAQNALKRQTGGSGLGLFIAKAVVKGLGGSIGFESQEGKGSTFWFTLPLVR